MIRYNRKRSLCFSLAAIVIMVFSCSFDEATESLKTGSNQFTLAERNRNIVRCYGRLLALSYDVNTPSIQGEDPCDTIEERDDRNGMGAWVWEDSWQPTGYAPDSNCDNRELLTVWHRFNNVYGEIALVFRGSVGNLTEPDWWDHDIPSQTRDYESPEDMSISNLNSDYQSLVDINIGDDEEQQARRDAANKMEFCKGFQLRVRELQNAIDEALVLFEQESAEQGVPLRTVKVAGHSLGGAAATIAGLYIANRYADSQNTSVEVVAFNAPRFGNRYAASYYRYALMDRRNLFTFNEFHTNSDIVYSIPVDISLTRETVHVYNFSLPPTVQQMIERSPTDNPDNREFEAYNIWNRPLHPHDYHQWSNDWADSGIFSHGPAADNASDAVAETWFPIERPTSLNQARWVSGTSTYEFGANNAIPVIPIFNAPADTDYSRWAMLHDGDYYRLYFFRIGSNDTLYQFSFHQPSMMYEYGRNSIDILQLEGVPADADTSNFAMLHDGLVYRLYLRSASDPDLLYQFGYNLFTRRYEHSYLSGSPVRVSGFPEDADRSRWSMLHDGFNYRFYQFKAGSDTTFYQGAFNWDSLQYEYGFRSIPVMTLVDMPDDSRTDSFAMLHDHEGFYSLYFLNRY